jgi:hypothetical protein
MVDDEESGAKNQITALTGVNNLQRLVIGITAPLVELVKRRLIRRM